MTLYRWKDGKFEQIESVQPEVRTQIISDEMPSTWHPVTNRRHTSKSSFRKDTIASGCREVGDQVPINPSPRVLDDTPGRKEELIRVYDELKHGRRD